MASASAAQAVGPAVAMYIPRRRMPAPATSVSNVSKIASSGDGAPVLHPGKIPPRLHWPDIGHLGKWSVSSCKFGFGAECLVDDDPDTFWHSDGPQPHFITIEFPRKVAIQKLSIYLSYNLDDSYTPAALLVRAGTGMVDLQDTRPPIPVDKPDGWVTFDVCLEPNDDGDGLKHIEAYVLQIIIVANHMNGKDTHVRGLKVLGPVERKLKADEEPFPFVAPQFKMYECIR